MLNKIYKKRNIILEILFIIIISIFAFSVTPKTLQNDTFYTVTIGNDIIENGIDMQDHYSWIEDLPYTYPHWLYDVAMSIIYNNGGWTAIYIATCISSIILGISIYMVNKKMSKNHVISFAISIGSMYLLKSYIAARAQLATFILFIIAIYFIEKFIENPKKFYYGVGIVTISAIIANIHVAVWPFLFILTLPYIGEYLIGILSEIVIYQKIKILFCKIRKKLKIDSEEKYIEKIEKINLSNEKRKEYSESQESYKIKLIKNKNVKWLILIVLICALTGILTPLGKTPYTYLYTTIKGNTTEHINEHQPLTLANDVPMICTLIIVFAVLTFTNTKIKLSDLLMLGGLMLLMFLSKRQSTMFVLIGGIILNKIIVQLIEKYIKTEKKSSTNGFEYILILGVICIAIGLSSNYIKDKKNDAYINEKTYPVAAADWILENLDIENIKIFNEYNYGSYLLHRGIPVFIDSRADLYAPEFSGKEDDIFMDFINTSNISKYYGNTFEKYEITHVILYKNSKIAMLIRNNDYEKYNEIYLDDNFVIYEINQEQLEE